jgi:hypothetical protein
MVRDVCRGVGAKDPDLVRNKCACESMVMLPLIAQSVIVVGSCSQIT